MRFWDSSALVPLLVDEPTSGSVASLLSDDRALVVWWGTRIECVSALRRRERDESLPAGAVEDALGLLDELAAAWHEVLPGEELRRAAERALAVHAVRAADALQLAAALVWSGPGSVNAELVCLDDRLRDAAAREGFRLLPRG